MMPMAGDIRHGFAAAEAGKINHAWPGVIRRLLSFGFRQAQIIAEN
jgi:hypothetical protein